MHNGIGLEDPAEAHIKTGLVLAELVLKWEPALIPRTPRSSRISIPTNLGKVPTNLGKVPTNLGKVPANLGKVPRIK